MSVTMQRITISIPDELLAEIDRYRREDETLGELETAVEGLLARFLSEPDDWGGRQYRPPSAPLVITPAEFGSRFSDISVDHDRYLTEQ